MDWKKVVSSLMIAGSMLAVACGGDDDGNGGPVDLCENPDGCETHFFVLNTLDVGRQRPTGTAGIVAGFNIDDLVSDGSDVESCNKVDFTSPPPDNEMGVDNQLGEILAALGDSFDVTGSIADALADGSVLIITEVTDVDDLVNDERVTLGIMLGELPAGVTAPMLDGTGKIAAGQTFDIEPASLMGDRPLVQVEGNITNGRLSAGPVDIRLEIPISDASLVLNIKNAQVRMDMASSSVGNGIIGGALDVDETLDAIVAIDPDTIPRSVAEPILSNAADLEADAMGLCQSISVGLEFGGTTAVRGGVAP